MIDWTPESCVEIQQALDDVFVSEERLKSMRFSLTIADPRADGCPLIGCSQGFTTLCGYSMDEIVGRNCRFLVDSVPPELVDIPTRSHAREFFEAVRDGRLFHLPKSEQAGWSRRCEPADDGIFCAQ